MCKCMNYGLALALGVGVGVAVGVGVKGTARTEAAEAAPAGQMIGHMVYFTLNDASDAAKAKLVADCKKYLTNHPGEMYFGELTAVLQDSLLDDPGVHRRTVKSLLQNLLTWCEALGIERVTVDRPRHSQRITMNES